MRTVADCFADLDQYVDAKPETLDLVMTELHCLLNKYDPISVSKKSTRSRWLLVRDGFDSRVMMKQITDTAGMPDLKVQDIRLKADSLSELKEIPLPGSTRTHREALLQWFKINWDAIVDDIRTWGLSSSET